MTTTFQFIAALLVGVCYYMLAMAMTVYDGLLSLIVQPVMALILTTIGIGLAWIIGLPIRVSRTLRSWWIEHWWISFFIGAVAFAMMWVSWLPGLRVQVWNPDLESHQDSFEPLLALGGWLLTIFAAFHFFPPLKQRRNAVRQKRAEPPRSDGNRL